MCTSEFRRMQQVTRIKLVYYFMNTVNSNILLCLQTIQLGSMRFWPLTFQYPHLLICYWSPKQIAPRHPIMLHLEPLVVQKLHPSPLNMCRFSERLNLLYISDHRISSSNSLPYSNKSMFVDILPSFITQRLPFPTLSPLVAVGTNVWRVKRFSPFPEPSAVSRSRHLRWWPLQTLLGRCQGGSFLLRGLLPSAETITIVALYQSSKTSDFTDHLVLQLYQHKPPFNCCFGQQMWCQSNMIIVYPNCSIETDPNHFIWGKTGQRICGIW